MFKELEVGARRTVKHKQDDHTAVLKQLMPVDKGVKVQPLYIPGQTRANKVSYTIKHHFLSILSLQFTGVFMDRTVRQRLSDSSIKLKVRAVWAKCLLRNSRTFSLTYPSTSVMD